MLSKNWIEEKAVEIVKQALLSTKMIGCSQIKQGDRDVSWDGELIIYNSEQQTKENIYIIPVQIKGTTKEFSKTFPSFPLEVEHLKNFYHRGGTVLFCVYIDEINNRHKIYYNSLLTSDLGILISSATGFTKRIPLKEFPEDSPSEIMVIMRDYIVNKPKQMYLIGEEINATNFSKTLDGRPFIIPFSFPKNESDVLTYLTKDSHYIYSKIPGTRYDELICKAKNIVISQTINISIYVGKKKYFDKYTVIRKDGNVFVVIGDVLTIYPPNNDDLCEIKVSINGTIEKQLTSTKFIVDLFTKKSFKIGTSVIPYTGESNEEIKRLEHRLRILKANKKALKMMDVYEQLNYDSLNEKDHKTLDALTKAMLFNQNVIFENQYDNLLYGSLFLGNLRINLWATKKDDNSYLIESFNNRRDIALFSEDDKTHEHPDYVPYCVLLSAEDYAYSSNLNYNKLYSEIVNGKWSSNALSHILDSLLEMIKALDIKPKRSEKLYCLINRVCNYLISQKTLDETLMYINKMQIVRRKRELNKNEINRIRNILDNETILDYICALNILLGDFQKATKFFDEMDEEAKQRFSKYPIYNLINNDNY